MTGKPRSSRALRLLATAVVLVVAVTIIGLISPPRPRRHAWQSVSAVAFSPDGKYLAAGLAEGTSFGEDFHWCIGDLHQTVSVFELDKGFAGFVLDQSSRPGTHRGLPGRPQGEFLCFTPDSAALVAGTWDGQVKLWDPRSRQLRHLLNSSEDPVTAVSVSHDGQLIAAGFHRYWTLWEGGNVQKSDLRGSISEFNSMSFSPDGRFLAVGGDEWEFEIWNLRDDTPKRYQLGDDDKAYSLAYSPDGNLLAIGCGHRALLWDVKQHKQRFTMPVDGATGVAFSPDGKTLAVTGNSRLCRYSTETGKIENWSDMVSGDSRCVAWSPDGRLLATGWRWADRITVLDAHSGKWVWSGSVKSATGTN